MRRPRSLLLAALVLTTAIGHAADTPPPPPLSAKELQVAALVTSRAEAAISLLERAVNINSGTMNLAGVRETGDLYRAEFDALGLATQWVEGSSFNRAGHLIARSEGSGPRLLLIGHLDTVFELSSPFRRFERTGARATGPGVVDMKGGNVVIVEALRALRAAGLLDEVAVTAVLIGDEERSGRPLHLARAALLAAAQEASYVLAFENGDSNPATAVVARRGASGWRLEVTGTPAHSSQLFQPQVGVGAIYETARILDGFRQRLAGEELLTFNPGVILGGTDVTYDAFTASGTAFGKNNVVAGSTTVTGDLRAISLEQLERARTIMREVAAESLPGTSARLEFTDGYPPLAPVDGNYDLLRRFSDISVALGQGEVTAVHPRNAGAADVSFTAGIVANAIDGLGPGGGNDHTVDEFIDLPTLAMQTQRAAILMWRLSRESVSD